MKHFLLSLLVFLAGICGFTSCDSMIASSLEGTWEGEMYFASYYDGRYYYSNYTEIEFVGDPYRFKSGRGYWIDHYSGAPWDYVANHFTWQVRDKIIYIHLIEDDYDIEIHNYRLNDERFTGDVYYEGEDRYFELVHTYSPNWDDYDYGYGYYGGGYYGGYYSQRRSAEWTDADTTDRRVPAGIEKLKERPRRVLTGGQK